MSSGTVLVYNLGRGEVLNRVTVKQARNMIWRGVARLVEAEKGSEKFLIERPRAVELVRYVVAKWRYERTGEVPYSKEAIFRRDHFTCAYCMTKLTRAECTMDHVIPKSRWKKSGMAGTPSNYNNVVTSCQPCNNKKRDRTPKEAGMKLHILPKTPTFQDAFDLTRRG